MPNEKNVEALMALLLNMAETDAFAMLPDNFPPEYARLLAEQLASRGVLVPSALTDEEARSVSEYLDTPAGDTRATLERIAKGELSS